MSCKEQINTDFDDVEIDKTMFCKIIDKIREDYNIDEEYIANLFMGTDVIKLLNGSLKIKKIKYDTVNVEDGNIIKKDCTFGLYELKKLKIITFKYRNYSYTIIFSKTKKEIEEQLHKRNIKIKSGTYAVIKVFGGCSLKRINLKHTTKPTLNDNLDSILLKEIRSFIDKRKLYTKLDIDYKRGILLYGLPGNGKTCFIKHLLKQIDNSVSIICNAKNSREIEFIGSLLTNESLERKLKIIVLEDIDGICEYDRSEFLNLIDGVFSTDDVIFIATTNYPEKLDIGITNRPSRFDTIYEVESPNDESRRKLILNFFKDLDEDTLRTCVYKTKGFRGAYFKEIHILTNLHNCTILEAIELLNKKFKKFSEFSSSDTILYR